MLTCGNRFATFSPLDLRRWPFTLNRPPQASSTVADLAGYISVRRGLQPTGNAQSAPQSPGRTPLQAADGPPCGIEALWYLT